MITRGADKVESKYSETDNVLDIYPYQIPFLSSKKKTAVQVFFRAQH
jgi:hypothetical protein